MPTPPRTSLDGIVRAGREILDADGVEALTMQRVATAVGVRAPSLYKHVRDRDALVRLIAADVLAELGGRLESVAVTGDPGADLRAIAGAFRAFAHEHPGAYGLLFTQLPEAWRLEPDRDLLGGSFGPLFRSVEALAGPADLLDAARTVVAWASGFVGMELAGAFQLGGDVDAAFDYGAGRIVVAIQQATFDEHV